MGHRVRHLLRRDTSFAPMRPRKVRQSLRERDWGEIDVSSSPTLHRTKPLTRNLRTPADEENAGDWSEKDSDGTSSTDGERDPKKKQKRLRMVSPRTSQSNCTSWRGSDPREFVLPRESVSESRDRSKVHKASRAVPQFCGVDAAIVLYLNMSNSQGRPVSDGHVLPGGASVLPTPVREVGRTKTRSVVESSEGLEKKGSDTIKTTMAKNDLVWSLLGDGEKQETSDGRPCPDDGCDVLPTWGTLAVDARGPDQTNVWRGKRLATSPPLRSTRRAEQNAKLRRHERPEKSDVPLDHQRGCSPGGRPSLREDLRVPIRRLHQRVSKSNTCTGS